MISSFTFYYKNRQRVKFLQRPSAVLLSRKKLNDRIYIMNKTRSVEKHNYISMIIEGCFYFTGYTFFDIYVVIPVFIDALTGDLRLAGLAVALRLSCSSMPQLLMGFYTTKIKKTPRFLGTVGIIGRSSYFFAPLFLVLDVSPYIKVYAVIFALTSGALCDGLTHVPWLDIFGRTIAPRNRGRILGYQMLLGGLGGLVSGVVIKQTLSGNGPSEMKYAFLFLLGAVGLIISGSLLFTLKDTAKDHIPEQIHIAKFFRQLPGYLSRDRNYQNMVITQTLAGFSGLAAPLYILFAKDHFALANDQTTTLMFVQILGGLAAGMLWGNMSHRKGNKATIRTGLIFNLVTVALAVFLFFTSITAVMPLLIIMVFLAGIILGNWIGFINYLLDLTTDENRPVYVALTSVLLFPTTLIPFLGGVIADSFGFLTVFISVALMITLALIMSSKLK
jgi:MFS family permease